LRLVRRTFLLCSSFGPFRSWAGGFSGAVSRVAWSRPGYACHRPADPSNGSWWAPCVHWLKLMFELLRSKVSVPSWSRSTCVSTSLNPTAGTDRFAFFVDTERTNATKSRRLLVPGSTNTALYPTRPISRDVPEPSIPDQSEDEPPAVQQAVEPRPRTAARSLTARRSTAESRPVLSLHMVLLPYWLNRSNIKNLRDPCGLPCPITFSLVYSSPAWLFLASLVVTTTTAWSAPRRLPAP